MNNKGFTLVELIITIVLLSVVLSIGAYSIISIVKDSKKSNYETVIKSIKSAVETYAIECKYNDSEDDIIDCSDNQVTLGELVRYGYLTGNSKYENKENANDPRNGTYIIVNPKDNVTIDNCTISFNNNNGKITITAVNPTGSCPSTANYAGDFSDD